MTLAQIKPGHGGVIATVEGEGALRRHLLDMGLTPGTKVMVRKVCVDMLSAYEKTRRRRSRCGRRAWYEHGIRPGGQSKLGKNHIV